MALNFSFKEKHSLSFSCPCHFVCALFKNLQNKAKSLEKPNNELCRYILPGCKQRIEFKVNRKH